MRRIGRAGIVLLMARVAECAVQRVVVVYVAVRTLARRHGVRSGQREAGAVVVERGIQPGAGAVALVTCLREVRRYVTRIRRSLVLLQVARHASRTGQIVVVVDMAVGTLPRRHAVCPGQRKSGAVVIECRVQPGTGVVALIAGLREVRRYVIRIRCALEIFKVAGHASRAVQRVVIVDVAVDALPRRHGVRAGQRESGRGVVKLRVRPQHGVVALLACRGKSRMRHWRGRGVVVVLVATDACSAGDAVVVADVAIRALSWRHSVRSGQRKPGLGVIKRRRLPGGCVVAGIASLRESAADVVGIAGALEVLQMARHARGAGQVVVVAHVAVGALARRYAMRAGQCEVHHRVIETGRCPSHRGVALGTV